MAPAPEPFASRLNFLYIQDLRSQVWSEKLTKVRFRLLLVAPKSLFLNAIKIDFRTQFKLTVEPI